MKQKVITWATKNKGQIILTLYIGAVYWTGALLGGLVGYSIGWNALFREIAKKTGNDTVGSIIFDPKAETLIVKKGIHIKRYSVSDETLAKWSNAVCDAIARGVPAEELTKVIDEIVYKIEHGVNSNE